MPLILEDIVETVRLVSRERFQIVDHFVEVPVNLQSRFSKQIVDQIMDVPSILKEFIEMALNSPSASVS